MIGIRLTSGGPWRVALAVLLTAPIPAIASSAERSCAEAAAVAETRERLPPGLLLAIGKVESGRRDVAGHRSPWPWTVQAQGTGYFLSSSGDATALVHRLHAAGVRSIDIGCFQINLLQHPEAFADIAEGFVPMINAFAAAAFLRELHAELGSWPAAVAAYHSRTDELGGPYRDQVLASLRGGVTEAAAVDTVDVGWVRLPGAVPARVHIWGPEGHLVAGTSATQSGLPRVLTPIAP